MKLYEWILAACLIKMRQLNIRIYALRRHNGLQNFVCFFLVYHYKVTLHTGSGIFADLTRGAVKIIMTGDNYVSEEITLPE